MKLEPNTFFISIIDFFSVMLPGAVVTSLVSRDAEMTLFPSVFPKYTGEAAGWAVFLFSSYLLGHFIFLIGSNIDTIYDKIRTATKVGKDAPSAEGDKPPSRLHKWLAKKIFPKNPDLAVDQVCDIKENCVPDVDGKAVINAFQWAKARLTIQCPMALLDVQRFEADSKFFRSMVVVLLFSAAWLSVKASWDTSNWLVVVICLLLSCFSFWRYAERRFKSTQQAYWYVITLERCPPPPGNNQNS